MNLEHTTFPGLIVRPTAVKDLRAIFLYLSQNSVPRAWAFVDAAEATFVQLVALPHLGSPRSLLPANLHGLRQWPVQGFKNHLIFYRPFASDNGIEVLRVLHGSRDVQAALEDEATRLV